MVETWGFTGVWVVVLTVVLTLAAVMVRPWGLPEAAAALLGGGVMLGLGAVSLADARAVLVETSDILLFLLGMMLLSGVAEQAGVFAWMAEQVSQLARGSGRALYLVVFLLAAVITALLSLDVTVLILTPIIFNLTRQRRLDPVPFMFACVFIANVGSLLLPVSNLTNLLVADQRDLRFGEFVRVLWLPNLVAVGTTLLLFFWLFRRQLPARYELPPPVPALRGWWPVGVGLVGLITLAGLLAAGFANASLVVPALLGGGVVVAVGVVSGQLRMGELLRTTPWAIFGFIIGMFIVVRGFDHLVLSRLTLEPPATPGLALITSVGVSALGSNIVNNVPMTLLALSVIERAPAASQAALTYGALVGVNIGPALTIYGSLATMLWLGLLRERGLEITTGAYLKVAVITTPIVLLTTAFSLWLVLR